MAKDKRFWANVAAGTVAVIAIIFGVKQCSDKQDAESLNRQAATALEDQLQKIKDLNKELDEMDQETIALRDTIDARDAKIISLQDSLAICREGQVCPCTGEAKCNCGKSNCCKCCKPKPKPKPKQKKKPAPVKTTPKENCAPATTTVVVKSDDDKVVVKNQKTQPNQSVIINGDNNGNVIVNSNGVVNANGNVNGHDNNVNTAAARRKQMMQGCTTTTTVVLGTRSKCR